MATATTVNQTLSDGSIAYSVVVLAGGSKGCTDHNGANMTLTTKAAEQVALGERVQINPHETARVTRICRNPVHGWIGFELNDSPRFWGWFNPQDQVALA